MARTHVVNCYGCGRQFDVNKSGGGYDKIKHKYYCPSCYREKKREIKKAVVQERLQRTGMKQSYLAMIVKIILGILFIWAVLDGAYINAPSGEPFAFIIGILLIGWGLIPFIFRKRRKDV